MEKNIKRDDIGLPTDIAILESVERKIKNSKSLDPEFSRIIEDNFWELI